jgi:hypothetical protein
MTDEWTKPRLSEDQVRDLDAILIAWTFGNHGLGPFCDGTTTVVVSHLEKFVERARVLAEYGLDAGKPRTLDILSHEHVATLVRLAQEVLEDNLADLKYLDDPVSIDHQASLVASAHKVLAVLEPLLRRNQ